MQWCELGIFRFLAHENQFIKAKNRIKNVILGRVNYNIKISIGCVENQASLDMEGCCGLKKLRVHVMLSLLSARYCVQGRRNILSLVGEPKARAHLFLGIDTLQNLFFFSFFLSLFIRFERSKKEKLA